MSKLRERLPEALKGPLRRLAWKQLTLDHRLPSDLTVSVRSHADWIIYNEIFVAGEYDLPIREALEGLDTGTVLEVCDLGANVGFFTVRFADLLLGKGFPPSAFHATLVEGAPSVFSDLRQRLSQQQPISSQLRFCHGLIGELHGTGIIVQTHRHFANRVFPDGHVRGTKVPYLNLYDLYPPPASIGLLKCDIEGSELSFLRNYGELLRRTRAAIFELHQGFSDPAACLALIRESGFSHHLVLRQESLFSVHYFHR